MFLQHGNAAESSKFWSFDLKIFLNGTKFCVQVHKEIMDDVMVTSDGISRAVNGGRRERLKMQRGETAWKKAPSMISATMHGLLGEQTA